MGLTILRLLFLLFAALCLAQPAAASWKRINIIQVNFTTSATPEPTASSDSGISFPSLSESTDSSIATPPPTIIDPSSSYTILATGSGNCKQGFIGNINVPACWTSTCGAWKALKIRKIYNATITMYPTNACTGPAEKINPICAPGDLEQNCGFGNYRFRSFRVVPGCAQNTPSNVCSGGLQSIDCSSTDCLGTVMVAAAAAAIGSSS